MALADIVERISRISGMSNELGHLAENVWKDEFSSSDPKEIMKALRRKGACALELSVRRSRKCH